jgi:DNA-binding MarR family transcriptional regulator
MCAASKGDVMTDPIWDSFRDASEMLENGISESVSLTVDLLVNASLETVADALPVSPASVLREGGQAAKSLLNLIASKAELDRTSLPFLAGRISAAVDVLGYAAHQTADEKVLDIATTQPFAKLLALLAERPHRNVDLVKSLGKDKSTISKLLGTLRQNEAVTSHRHGRETYNALTPVGRLIVEKGIEDRRRISVENSRVFDFGSHRYNLNAVPPPANVETGELVRISASGS